MRCSRKSLFFMLLVSWCCFATEAHVHGTAVLQIVVDGKTLQLYLESPLDSLLGFEFQPHTAQEIAAVKQMKHHLQQADRLFRPTPAAHCLLKSVVLKSAVLATTSPLHDDHEHLNLDGEFIFECAKPNKLQGLDLGLFAQFPRLKKLKVELATPDGQTATALTSPQQHIAW